MSKPVVTCSKCGKGFESVMKLMQHFSKVHSTAKEKQ